MPRKRTNIHHDQTIFTDGIFIQPHPPTYDQLQAQVELWQKRSAKMLCMGFAIGALLCFIVGQVARCMK